MLNPPPPQPMLKSTGSILASRTQHCLGGGEGRGGQLGVLFPLCTSV